MAKFRCWDKRQNKFIQDVVMSPSGAPEILRGDEELNRVINRFYNDKGDMMWGDYNIVDFTDWYAINECVLNLSTEDKDKEGKEIFESDYVKFMGEYYWVNFRRGCFLLENEEKEIWWHQLNGMDIQSSMLIIGNRYEQRKTKLNTLNELE